MHETGFMSDKEKHRQASSKGGSKKGVLKGWAYMKVHDPKRFAELIKNRKKTNEHKTV